ncbi:MAG: hypothetical protein NVSMB62_24320 [Acidobacteriaceae bacterium]
MRTLGVLGLITAAGMSPCLAAAQGTKLWTVSRYDEMERGQAQGISIRSDGRLQPGPATSLLYQTTGNYVWTIAADAAGNAYAGMGGTAAGGAIVMKVASNGSSIKVFEGKELGVQSLRVAPGGKVYAATSPDGKIYRLGSSPSEATVVFDPAQTPEKPKYLWDLAFGPGGKELFVAAGAPAVVYRVPLTGSGTPEVAFRTTDQHIRCLVLAPDGTLWAGTDGSGVIYRFDTKSKGAKPFAAYAANRREITSLALDSAGNIYAAGVGTRPAPNAPQPGLPPLPVTGAVGVTVTFSQPGSANAATANTLIPEGSEIYRIAPDGSPARLLTLKEDVVYALAFDDGSLLAATGNRGRIYRIDVGSAADSAGRFADVAHLEASQATAFAAIPGGQIVGTSNSGKIYRIEDRPAANATYTSEVFDSGGFAQWGRVEIQGSTPGAFDLFERSGNVENPAMGWSDWMPAAKDGAVALPGGRFAQWKAVLRTGSALDSVGLNYLGRNTAPIVDEVVVQTGARVVPSTAAPQAATVPVSFPAASGAPAFQQDPNTQPLTAQKDRTGITARWAAHDDNGDDLMFAVLYRGTGEHNWRLLKDKISDRFLSFDAGLLPDGRYELKVVASDAPVHSDAEALTGERVSTEFLVDTTPPVPGPLAATLAPSAPKGTSTSSIHATFSAKDATSPIAHAEYSVDAGPWQYLEPVGRVSDSLEEHYDFTVPIPALPGATPTADPKEHILAVRVYDRFDNAASVKTVVR